MPSNSPTSLPPLLADFASAADAPLLSSWLKTAERAAGLNVMRWLLEHRRPAANQVLCLMYGVSWHQVKASCFSSSHSGAEQDSWFAGVPVTEGFENVEVLCLRATVDEVCADVVRAFQLEAAFFDTVAAEA